MKFDIDFYKGKKILITGHTGFKGSWMCMVLKHAGAEVTGLSDKVPTTPSLFEISKAGDGIRNITGDVRDLNTVLKAFEEAKPEIVIHMAAQPIVRESYKNPVYTYETNVIGTVNVLEAVRLSNTVKSVVNVTTDKVYLNKNWEWGYRETDELNGYDPYSNSKSCSELVTSSYINSFLKDKGIAVSTCRAGNVIGGGDFADDRIIPDCIRAALDKKEIIVRNPYSTRPYQHVLEPVMTYLNIAKLQYEDASYAGNYNIGPDDSDCLTTGKLVDMFCEKWNAATGDNIKWVNISDDGPHEAKLLKLDCSKIKAKIGWKPTWTVNEAMEKIVDWSVNYNNHLEVSECMRKQIEEFLC